MLNIWTTYSFENLMKNPTIVGNAIRWLKYTPVPKSSVAVTTNGTMTFFSRA
ncbi:hypothetical protein D3C83_235020 [compost metagenome]